MKSSWSHSVRGRLLLAAVTLALYATGCGRTTPGFGKGAIQSDAAMISTLARAVRDEAGGTGRLLVVTLPSMQGRAGESDRGKALRAAVDEALAGSSMTWELRTPSEADMAARQESIFSGDFPASVLSSLLTQISPAPTALICFKGIPVGTPDELDALKAQVAVAGYSTYGMEAAAPLLRHGVLDAVAVLNRDSSNASSANAAVKGGSPEDIFNRDFLLVTRANMARVSQARR